MSSVNQSSEILLEKSRPTDFRQFLQSELVRRTKLNPRFSLRAFAKHLNVQSGFLSKLLLGQRRITPAVIERFGPKLGLNLQEIEAYQKISRGEESSLDFRQISYDSFQMISDWYHFAILELASIEEFDPHPRWISDKLGISLAEAKDATERLIRLGYVSQR